MDSREMGRKGGLARARKLTRKQLSEIGKKGGLASGKARKKAAHKKKKKSG